MRKVTALALAGAIGFGVSAGASAQMLDKKTLSLAEAMKVSAAAQEEAKKNNWTMVVAVVDDGGNLILLHRMDETQLGSIRVAQDKAESALRFKRSTKVFEDGVAGGRNALLGLTGATPIEGGLPITSGGKIIGAIGISGGTAPQDGQVAKAGMEVVK
jgi:glc operon protein GlcG